MRVLLAFVVLSQVARPPVLTPPTGVAPPATLSYGVHLTYGPHAVGWRFEPRPVPMTVFYPADAGTGEDTTFGELAKLSNDGPPLAALDKAPVKSRRNATAATGNFPLVLFAHTAPVGQLVMSEYLASYGFVVAGVAPRIGYRLSVDDVRTMVSDLESALSVLLAMPAVDRLHVGIIGMSNGAFGAVGLARRLPLAALVSLDGTIGERAAARILRELAAASPPPAPPAVLHLYTPDNPYLDLAQLKARGPECVAVRIPAIAHADFLSYGALVPVGSPPFTRLRPAEKFAAVNRLTLDFLRARFRSPPSVGVRLTDGDRVLGLERHACGTQN